MRMLYALTSGWLLNGVNSWVEEGIYETLCKTDRRISAICIAEHNVFCWQLVFLLSVATDGDELSLRPLITGITRQRGLRRGRSRG